MPHSDFDPEIEELAEDHAEVEQAMLAAVLAYLAGEITLDVAEAQIDAAAAALEVAGEGWVEDVLPNVYEDGRQEALASLQSDEDGSGAPAPDDGDSLHQEALALFQDDLSAELALTTDRMTEDAKTSLREIARRQLSSMMASGTNAIPQAAEMAEELRENGVRFVDRSGRRWKPRAYSQMVLRTHSAEVSNEANLNTARQFGSPGVRVFDGGPGDVDEPCLLANGQAWSLPFASAHRTEHPSCRRAFAPLPSTFDGRLDRE